MYEKNVVGHGAPAARLAEAVSADIAILWLRGLPLLCKEAMEKTEYKTEEGAKTFCDLERASREGLLKKWNAIPSRVKWKCITDSNSQSYVMLSLCIDQQFKNNRQDGDGQQNSDN